MIKIFSQKNIFYYLIPLLFLVLSLAIINEIKAQPITDNTPEPRELPRIIRPPIERELCERIPLGETFEKHQQFQEEIFSYLMNFKTEAQTVFSNGLELADMVEQCDSKFCEANFDCVAKDCQKVRVSEARRVHGLCCIEIDLLFDDVCILRQNHIIHAFRHTISCPGKDHKGRSIKATTQEFLLGFFYSDLGWEADSSQRVTTSKYICVQGCGEFINPEDITPAMWRKIRNSMADDRVETMCDKIDWHHYCHDYRRFWYFRCNWFLKPAERFLTRLFLDMQFDMVGLWLGYHCTRCHPNPFHCTGSPCPSGVKEEINFLKQNITNRAQLSKKHLIKIQLFERALGELAGRFETISQSFQIWQRTRVGSLESCFVAKGKGRIDLCQHKLDFYICK